MDTEDVVRRFQREQQLLAGLNHPNIGQFYGAAVTLDGIPFFAMEYIAGKRIDDYCRDQGLALEARLELFLKACGAVHYAHQYLIVHRDIKPSNILVTAEGDAGQYLGADHLVTKIAAENLVKIQRDRAE
jgi:serine/threonine-protein kinase